MYTFIGTYLRIFSEEDRRFRKRIIRLLYTNVSSVDVYNDNDTYDRGIKAPDGEMQILAHGTRDDGKTKAYAHSFIHLFSVLDCVRLYR